MWDLGAMKVIQASKKVVVICKDQFLDKIVRIPSLKCCPPLKAFKNLILGFQLHRFHLGIMHPLSMKEQTKMLQKSSCSMNSAQSVKLLTIKLK